MRIAIVFCLLSLFVGACTPSVTTRGNMISQTKFDKIEPGASTRAMLVDTWGPPTTSSPFDENTWYYIGETTSQKGIYAPEVTARRIIRVKFDPANSETITEVAELNPAEARDIEIVDRTTPSAGKEYTMWQQFIGNLGKYNTDKTKKN